MALLEEKRDDIVTLLIRKLQGACYGHIKRKIFKKKKEQRYVYLTGIMYQIRQSPHKLLLHRM